MISVFVFLKTYALERQIRLGNFHRHHAGLSYPDSVRCSRAFVTGTFTTLSGALGVSLFSRGNVLRYSFQFSTAWFTHLFFLARPASSRRASSAARFIEGLVYYEFNDSETPYVFPSSDRLKTQHPPARNTRFVFFNKSRSKMFFFTPHYEKRKKPFRRPKQRTRRFRETCRREKRRGI